MRPVWLPGSVHVAADGLLGDACTLHEVPQEYRTVFLHTLVHTFVPTRNSGSCREQAPQAQFLTMLSHGVRTGTAVAA